MRNSSSAIMPCATGPTVVGEQRRPLPFALMGCSLLLLIARSSSEFALAREGTKMRRTPRALARLRIGWLHLLVLLAAGCGGAAASSRRADGGVREGGASPADVAVTAGNVSLDAVAIGGAAGFRGGTTDGGVGFDTLGLGGRGGGIGDDGATPDGLLGSGDSGPSMGGANGDVPIVGSTGGNAEAGSGGATNSGGAYGSGTGGSTVTGGGDWCGTGSVACGTGTCEQNAVCKTGATATAPGSCTCPSGYQRLACDGVPCTPDNRNCQVPNLQCVKCPDGAPCLAFSGLSCGAETEAANGYPTASGTTWVFTNVGGSGTIDITASVPGNPDAGVAGEPTVSQQFDVAAGGTYSLTVCVPVAASSCSSCERTCNPGQICYVEGPVLDVAFSGISGPSVSSVAALSGYSASAVGTPVIGLTESASESSSGCFVNYGGFIGSVHCPSPAGCVATNASGATCSVAGDVYCGGTVCCSPSYPYFCSATKKCYSTSTAAAAACGSISCSECAAPS
jgi:hypothetical protein